MSLGSRLRLLTEHRNHRLECKPLRNVIPRSQHLTKLGARELLDLDIEYQLET